MNQPTVNDVKVTFDLSEARENRVTFNYEATAALADVAEGPHSVASAPIAGDDVDMDYGFEDTLVLEGTPAPEVLPALKQLTKPVTTELVVLAIYDFVQKTMDGASEIDDEVSPDRRAIFYKIIKSAGGPVDLNLLPNAHPADYEDTCEYQCDFKYIDETEGLDVQLLFDCTPHWSIRGIARNKVPAATRTIHAHKYENYCDCELEDLAEVAWTGFEVVFEGHNQWAGQNMLVDQGPIQPVTIVFDGRADDHGYPLMQFSMEVGDRSYEKEGDDDTEDDDAGDHIAGGQDDEDDIVEDEDVCARFYERFSGNQEIHYGWAKRRPDGQAQGTVFSESEKLITLGQKETWEQGVYFQHGAL